MLQQHEIPVPQPHTPTPTPAPSRDEAPVRPIERALAEITRDAHEAPSRYLRETVVPKGGE